MTKIEYIAIPNIPIVNIGDDIAQIIVNNCRRSNIQICDGDIIVIAQKIISISENAIVNLNHVVPSEKAIEISKLTGRTPEECQVFIDESTEILEDMLLLDIKMDMFVQVQVLTSQMYQIKKID